MNINEILQEEFTVFLLTVPAKRLKQNTVRILLYFLQHESSEGLPEFTRDLYTDLLAFFDLLDIIDKEVDQSDLL